MIVDLFTTSKNIQDRMMSEFPHPFNVDKQSQIIHSNGKGNNIYAFLSFSWENLSPYLEYLEQELEPSDEYEIRDETSGRFLVLRRNGRTLTDQTEIKKATLEYTLVN